MKDNLQAEYIVNLINTLPPNKYKWYTVNIINNNIFLYNGAIV